MDASAMLRSIVAGRSAIRVEDIPSVQIGLRPASGYPIEVGTVIFSASADDFDDGLRGARFDVALGEPELVAGTPVVTALQNMGRQVEGVVRSLGPLLP